MRDEVTVKRKVRKLVLEVCKPLRVNGVSINTPQQINPAWRLGTPFPIAMDKLAINGALVPRLDLLVKEYKSTGSFTPGDIKTDMTVGDLQDSVWSKVKN